MEATGGESSYSFTTSAFRWAWVVSLTFRPRFTPGERATGTHWTGGWVDPRAGLHTEVTGKIICLNRESKPDCAVVQSESDSILTELPWLLRADCTRNRRWHWEQQSAVSHILQKKKRNIISAAVSQTARYWLRVNYCSHHGSTIVTTNLNTYGVTCRRIKLAQDLDRRITLTSRLMILHVP
jgi:hypothetical protein